MAEDSEAESSGESPRVLEVELLQQRERQHEENIQILVAVGILGAYFTVIASNAMALPDALRLPIDVIFVITFLFLFVKLAANSTTPVTSWEWLDPIDRYLPLVYLVSVVLTFLTIVVAFLDVQFTELVQQYAPFIPFLMVAIVIPFIPIVAYIGAKHQHSEAQERRDAIREQLPLILPELSRGVHDYMHDREIESIRERYDEALAHDDELSIWAYQSAGMFDLLGDGEPAFTNSELGHLLTICRRIEAGRKYEVIDDRDVEAIEEILRRAEGRIPPPEP